MKKLHKPASMKFKYLIPQYVITVTLINTFYVNTGYLSSVNNFKLKYYGSQLTSLFQFTSLSWLFSASITNLSHITRLYNNSVSHLSGSSDLCCLCRINRDRSAVTVLCDDWSHSFTSSWWMHRGALLRAFGVFSFSHALWFKNST